MIQEMKDNSLQEYLENLSPNQNTDYSLWKATKRLKQPQQPIPPLRKTDNTWARTNQEKADAFSDHLHKVFQPFPPTLDSTHENDILKYLQAPFQMSIPIKPITPGEIKTAMEKANLKKAPGYDLISGQVMANLSKKTIMFVTAIFNAILRIGHYPSQWKIAQIILILKPGKPPNEVTSYRPISLLPAISKIFEKLYLKRLKPFILEIIPDHQFGFREQHATIEQIHRVVNTINKAFEEKQYCSAAFIDVSQAFDKVWHSGLLYKLKKSLPHPFYVILQSYLEYRCFQVKFKDIHTKLQPINAGVPQGSVLGPILYLLFTADLPTSGKTMAATFADDTAILSNHENPNTASQNLQEHLNLLQSWLSKWRIKVNESKSAHITFAIRRDTCPPITINNHPIPMTEDVKYLGMHLDRRLTWRKHIWTKRKQLNLKFSKMHWLLGRKSQLSINSKLLIYKSVLKPIWTYGIQLWGTGSNSNIEILERFQSKTLRTIAIAPWYINNKYIHSDLFVNTVKQEVTIFSTKYLDRLNVHPNYLAMQLLDNSANLARLKRPTALDLIYRY